MRAGAIGLTALALLLSIGCASGGSKAVPPTLTASATPAPSAREIIQRSNDAMNALQSVRVTTEVRPPDLNGSRKEVGEFVSPNRAHFVRTSPQDVFKSETIVIASDAWERYEPDGEWLSSPEASQPFAWPDFLRLEPRIGISGEPLPVTEPSILREEAVGDRPAWVASYSYQEPSFEGPFNVFVTEWIEKETYLLLREEHYDDDPYGVQARVTDVYFDFDAPITIQPPG